MVGGHVEGPQPLLDAQAVTGIGDHKTGDAAGTALPAVAAGKHQHMGRMVHAGGPHLGAIQAPAGHAVAGFRHRSGFQPGGVGAVLGLGQAESDTNRALDTAGNKRIPLLLAAKVAKRQGGGKVADDAVLVLQVAVQADTLGRQVLPDHCHVEVAGIAAAVLCRQREAEESRLPGEDPGLRQQGLPIGVGQAFPVPVRARILAAVVKETLVVAGGFQGFQLGFDEGIETGEKFAEVCRDQRAHCLFSGGLKPAAAASAGQRSQPRRKPE